MSRMHVRAGLLMTSDLGQMSLCVTTCHPVPINVKARTPLGGTSLHKALINHKIALEWCGDAIQHGVNCWLPAYKWSWCPAIRQWNHVDALT